MMIPTVQNKVNDQAARLTSMLIEYVAVMGNHPERTECRVRHQDITIWFHRRGKLWVLDATFEDNPDDNSDWKPVHDMSLQGKILAAHAILGLEQAMNDARTALSEELGDACDLVQNVIANMASKGRARR